MGCDRHGDLSELYDSFSVTTGSQYRHPTTGDSKTCLDDARPSIWTEIFCLPCYYQAKGNAYADCKNTLEAQGYVKQ